MNGVYREETIMKYQIIAWGYFGLGLALMYIMLAQVTKKVKIEVEPQQQADGSKEIAADFTPQELRIVS